jgi:hypothetical protein
MTPACPAGAERNPGLPAAANGVEELSQRIDEQGVSMVR